MCWAQKVPSIHAVKRVSWFSNEYHCPQPHSSGKEEPAIKQKEWTCPLSSTKHVSPYKACVSLVSGLPWYTTGESWSVASVHRSIIVSAPEGHHEECLVAQLDVGLCRQMILVVSAGCSDPAFGAFSCYFQRLRKNLGEEVGVCGGTSLAFLTLKRGSQN